MPAAVRIVAIVLSLLAPAAALADTPKEREWRFQVLLDGSPIGSQVFRETRDGQSSRVSIEASFDVKLLFFTAYSYRHRNEETWEGGCLKSMKSTTDDNGKAFRVDARPAGDGLVVETLEGREELPGCIDSFAYWNPAELRSPRLLNSQTGKWEEVTLRELGEETVPYKGQPTRARRVAIVGKDLDISLWYAGDDDWIALESTLASGRKLYYARQ